MVLISVLLGGSWRLCAKSLVKKVFPILAFLLLACVIWIKSDSALARGFVQDAELSSPRLSALRKEIQGGNRQALEQFWQAVTTQGAPLVEPIIGDDRHVLLTFLWRAKEETRNVVVAGGVAGNEFSENQMSRLLDTDLWHRTYKVRNDARFSYHLSLIHI